MAIPIQGRLAARREAPFHIQMAVETRAVVRGEARITGKVVRVFRANGQLEEGDDIAWAIWVCRPSDEPTGSAYIYGDDLARASFIEAYLLSVPVTWYPRLAHGSAAERANWRLIGDGEGLHWPDLDEDLSVEGLLAGRRSGESSSPLRKWLESRQAG